MEAKDGFGVTGGIDRSVEFKACVRASAAYKVHR